MDLARASDKLVLVSHLVPPLLLFKCCLGKHDSPNSTHPSIARRSLISIWRHPPPPLPPFTFPPSIVHLG